jgi:anti-anti-sigma factor
MHKPFQIAREPAPAPAAHVVILHLQGYLDAHTVHAFEQELQSVLDEGSRDLVIDCERLQYFSSAALSVLIDTYRTLTPQGGRIALAALNPALADILDMLGVSKIIPVYPSVAEALRSFPDRPQNASS